jgi:hypothetical protein
MTFIKNSFRKLGTFIIVLGVIVLLIAGGFYIYERFFKQGPAMVEDNKPREVFVVIFSRQAMSEQDVLKTYGRGAVLDVSDISYRLKLNPTQYESFKSSVNFKYTLLSNDYPLTNQGLSIWKVTFHAPVYSSKVQTVANYGSIIEELKDGSYLVWTTSSEAEKIKGLDIVESINPYLVYEKIGIDMSQKLITDKFDADISVLVIDNDLEAIKSAVRKYGIHIVEEENTMIIDDALAVAVLHSEVNQTTLLNALSGLAQIISVK